MLEAVRSHERSRESQPFAGLTDIGRSDRTCRDDWLMAATEREGKPVYRLTQIDAATYRGLCAWLGVRVEPAPDDWREEEPLYLHVWGGGVDERVQIEGRERERVENRERGRRPDPISLASNRNRFYYFAQLEKGDKSGRQPVSPPLMLTPPSADEAAKPDAARLAPAAETGVQDAGSALMCRKVKNLIQLTFVRTDSPVTRVAEGD